VFVDQRVEDVVKIVETVGLDAAQLHGAETPDYCEQLNKPELSLIKSVAVREGELPQIDGYHPDVLMLVDAHDAELRGGTGRTANWEVAKMIAAMRPTILAGGLSAANVALAVATVQPIGVDVSSGVESEPGIKDAAKLRRFFEALNG
jgi:phosphoribosylanthranilate isomerase